MPLKSGRHQQEPRPVFAPTLMSRPMPSEVPPADGGLLSLAQLGLFLPLRKKPKFSLQSPIKTVPVAVSQVWLLTQDLYGHSRFSRTGSRNSEIDQPLNLGKIQL
jgi:hypothetical protein